MTPQSESVHWKISIKRDKTNIVFCASDSFPEGRTAFAAKWLHDSTAGSNPAVALCGQTLVLLPFHLFVFLFQIEIKVNDADGSPLKGLLRAKGPL